MKKLRLSLDTLAVESFGTEDTALRWGGTVEAHDPKTDPSNCPTCDTCPDHCPVPA
jgi:formate hydrogenlyase subunit 6/NADH:ubiquinone oxidoreductase subunit I